MKSKHVFRTILLLLFSTFMASCGLFRYNHVSPQLEDLGEYEIVFFDSREEKVRFATAKGEISQGYKFKVLTPGIDRNIYGSGILSMFTWGQDGNTLVFLARPYSPTGVPVMYEIATDQYYKCDLVDLPSSQTRVWSIGEKKVITVDNWRNNRVVTLDFETCEIEVLYEARTQEDISEKILEATLSSTGWLAITRYWKFPMNIYDILIISPEGEEYIVENAGFPAWSKDGERLAFIIEDKGIFISDKTGFAISQVESVSNVNLFGLGSDFVSWSPDGNKLVYSYLNDIYIYDFTDFTNELLIEDGTFPNWRWE